MGKRSREREKALAMGADARYGRYVRFACPAHSHAWIFFGPLAVGMGWGTAVDLMHIFKGEGGMWHGWFAPFGGLMTVFLAYCTLVSRIERRAGGPTPRLYCFQLGVVVATGDVLRSYRWTDLTIHLKAWRTGSGESADWGTRRTIVARDGSVVVVFPGNEPDRAGCYEVEQLHKAAMRGPGNPRPTKQ
ncbi:hypothetical protein ACFY1L_15005 [Streptomyces sp. NPDC001663]|uniref:hypothetical protein n=1 Tax=Streptomyces sp. NPDC001663 TaxID=3364597 RepID=UPI0036B151C7